MISSQIWPNNSSLRLVKVNWDSSYTDVVNWESQADKDNYFNSLSADETIQPGNPYTHLRPFQPIDIALEFNKVNNYNYLIVDNPEQADDIPRKYYYFITSAQFLAPLTTRVTLQLDVWTTYIDSTEFGYSFVQRSHLGIANEASTLSPESLRRYQSLPEGIDIGDVLAPISNHAKNLFMIEGQNVNDIYGTVNKGPMVVIQSTVALGGTYGDLNNPTQQTAHPTFADGMPQGAEFWAMTQPTFFLLMNFLSAYPWITRNIISIYLYPIGLMNWGSPVAMSVGASDIRGQAYFYQPENSTHIGVDVFNPIQELLDNLPDHYRKVKKLLTYPYSVIELSGANGNSAFYKPQLLNGNLANIEAFSNCVNPYAKTAFYIPHYGNQNSTNTVVLNQSWKARTKVGAGQANPIDINTSVDIDGDMLNSAVWFDDYPKLAILNDNYINTLANTAYVRQYNYDAAGWSQSNTMLSAHGNRVNTQLGINNDRKNASIGLGQKTLGAVGSIASGNIGGGVSQTINALGDLWQTDNSLSTRRQIADNNLTIAELTSGVDYQSAIAGINANVQQAQLTPPSQSGNTSGNGFAFGNGLTYLRYQTKTMLPQNISVVGDYFLRYGIAIQEFMKLPSNLLCMTKFAYWKTQETNIVHSNGNDADRIVLAGILEKGVTIWGKPEYIGNTRLAENEIKGGYSYG